MTLQSHDDAAVEGEAMRSENDVFSGFAVETQSELSDFPVFVD